MEDTGATINIEERQGKQEGAEYKYYHFIPSSVCQTCLYTNTALLEDASLDEGGLGRDKSLLCCKTTIFHFPCRHSFWETRQEEIIPLSLAFAAECSDLCYKWEINVSAGFTFSCYI